MSVEDVVEEVEDEDEQEPEDQVIGVPATKVGVDVPDIEDEDGED